MNLDQKRERCFEILLPEVLELIHEIHYAEAQELNEAFEAIRTVIRNAHMNGTKVCLTDKLVPQVMHLVEGLVNYRDFIALVDGLKSALPVHSINFIHREKTKDDERIKEFRDAVDFLEKHAGTSIAKNTAIGRAAEEAVKSIVLYVVNTETKIVQPVHGDCQFQ